MGVVDVNSALARVNNYTGRKHFVGGKDAAAIRVAENALGVRFPPSYRVFLEQLGAGSIRGREIYGVLDGDFRDSSVPDGIWLTLREREDSRLPANLVVVYSTGDGDYVAIDTAQLRDDSENPMVLWSPGASTPGGNLEEVAADFGRFFLQLVEEVTG